MLNVGFFWSEDAGWNSAGIEMLIVDHAVELVLATLRKSGIGDHGELSAVAVDCGHGSLLKETCWLAFVRPYDRC